MKIDLTAKNMIRISLTSKLF